MRPDDDSLRQAADILNGGNRVTILGGAGVAGAHDELVRLAGTLHAPIRACAARQGLHRVRQPLRRRHDGTVGLCLRLQGEQPPTLFLNPLPGDQYRAALAAAPTTRPGLKLPARILKARNDVRIPVGPTGVLVGAAIRDDPAGSPPIQRDDLVMWPLTDPQRATRITMDTSEFFVRQVLIRAAACGERIVIYSGEPCLWVFAGPTAYRRATGVFRYALGV